MLQEGNKSGKKENSWKQSWPDWMLSAEAGSSSALAGWKWWHSCIALLLAGLQDLFFSFLFSWRILILFPRGWSCVWISLCEGQGLWRRGSCWHIKLPRTRRRWGDGRLSADARRLLGAAADPSLTAPPLARFYLMRLWGCECVFPLTGRAYLYANEAPVTFKGGCLNSGKGTETLWFVWVEEKQKKLEAKGFLPGLDSSCPCRINHMSWYIWIFP